jgi:hypothetical protein
MKNHKMKPSEIKAAKDSNNYKFTRAELEAVIVVQRKIIERQSEELNNLRGTKANYTSPTDELPETD